MSLERAITVIWALSSCAICPLNNIKRDIISIIYILYRPLYGQIRYLYHNFLYNTVEKKLAKYFAFFIYIVLYYTVEKKLAKYFALFISIVLYYTVKK